MKNTEFSPSTNHWTLKDFKERVTRKQLQHVLLNVPPPFNGLGKEWKSKHIGAGIYELTTGNKP